MSSPNPILVLNLILNLNILHLLKRILILFMLEVLLKILRREPKIIFYSSITLSSNEHVASLFCSIFSILCFLPSVL